MEKGQESASFLQVGICRLSPLTPLPTLVFGDSYGQVLVLGTSSLETSANYGQLRAALATFVQLQGWPNHCPGSIKKYSSFLQVDSRD